MTKYIIKYIHRAILTFEVNENSFNLDLKMEKDVAVLTYIGMVFHSFQPKFCIDLRPYCTVFLLV